MRKILVSTIVFFLVSVSATAQNKTLAKKKLPALQEQTVSISKKTEDDQEKRIAAKKQYLIQQQNEKKRTSAAASLQDERNN